MSHGSMACTLPLARLHSSQGILVTDASMRATAPASRWGLVVVLAGLIGAAPAFAEAPTFLADGDSIAATGDLVWNAAFSIKNPLSVGLYLDSLSLDVDDLGPIESGRVKHTSSDVSAVLRTIDGVSAGEEVSFQ